MGDSDVEPSTDSVDPQANSDSEKDKPPSNIGFPPQIPPPDEHNRKTTNCKPDQTPLWKIVLEVGAVAVGIAVAMIYYGQLKVMRGQLGEIIRQFLEIQKSANANVKSADQTEKSVSAATANFKLDQRAWVGIVGESGALIANAPLLARLILRNSGKTPAIDTRIETDSGTKVQHQKRRFIRSKNFHSETLGLIPPNSDTGITLQEEWGTWGFPSQKDLMLVTMGQETPFIFGQIWYKDIFDKTREHWVTFCFDIHLAIMNPVPVPGQPVKFGQETA
jgi:hypothetical protein